MKTLNLGEMFGNRNVFVTLTRRNNRNGFTHNAEVRISYDNVVTARCAYCNRTWESYPFESVLKVLCLNLARNLFGVPSVHALLNTRKWSNARQYANFLLAQV